MPTTDERFAALNWAAGVRGAASQTEAIEWMATHGLADYDQDSGETVLTPSGIERADQIVDALQKSSASAEPFHIPRRVLVAAAVGALVLWRRRARH